MAWYAECKRRKWYRVVAFDAIRLYKKWLWCCLSNEEKERILKNRELEAERAKAESDAALERLLWLTNYMTSRCGGYYFKGGF